MTLRKGQKLFEAGRLHRVIRRGDVDVLADAQIDATIERRIDALTWLLVQTDSWIASTRLLKGFPSPIVGEPVHNDQFPVIERLFEYRIEPIAEELARIENGKANRDEGILLHS